MMKKLMVLSLVLAIGAMSSAAFEYNWEDGISVSTDAAISSYDLRLVVVEGDLTFGDTSFGMNFDLAPKHAVPATPTQVRITASQLFSPAVGPGELFAVAYTGLGTVEVYNMMGAGTGQGQLLTSLAIVPEPMTMGLLGLGALFLRRRK